MMAILVRSQFAEGNPHSVLCVSVCIQNLFNTGCYLSVTHINLKLDELNQTGVSLSVCGKHTKFKHDSPINTCCWSLDELLYFKRNLSAA